MNRIALKKTAQPILQHIRDNYPEEEDHLKQLLRKHPFFQEILADFLCAFSMMVDRFHSGRTLFLCGNGGSFADCIHIAGELMKTFKLRRPLALERKAALSGLEFGSILAESLQEGLPCHVLGLNPSLVSAIENDNKVGALQYAQELYVAGKQGDMLLGISTSGNAYNVRYAVSAAKARGMRVIGLTGSPGGVLADVADIAIQVPEKETYMVQEQHVIVYHALCLLLERRFFG
ncbi:phosphoheptose isomerase [candidate division KSB3 bacterium]|uniref:Phosphoheptose isomerase n=1 Tax=candidate division KSB3 bacterium TaxID=2044937 RepID=A0A2G6KGK8_9BACT|nr:MAG: phosphoheptose isomerase [candidate division KSB3 bacterium]